MLTYGTIHAIAAVAVLSARVAHAVDNFMPTIKPMAFDMYGMDKDLRTNMPPMPLSDIKVESWIPGTIPYNCFNGVGLERGSAEATINPWEFHVFNVTFKDCDKSWTGLSAMPVGIREAVSLFVAVPHNMPGNVAAWVHDGNTMVVQSPVYWSSPYLLMHEASHALDWTTLSARPFVDFWSYGAEWRAAVDRDGVVPSQYAASAAGPVEFNLRENFAELGAIALYDVNVPGGIAAYHANASAIRTQLDLYKSVVGEVRIAKGGRCSAAKADVRRIVDISSNKDDDAVRVHGAAMMAADDLAAPPVEPPRGPLVDERH